MFDGLDATVQAVFIAPHHLGVWAERVRPYLAKITDESGGRFVGSDMLVAIAAGRVQLWAAIKGTDLLCVMLTEIHTYPRLRAMRIFALAGRRPSAWRGLLPAVESAAKGDFGCSLMECVHLPRFGVLLPGYRLTHGFSEKALG